jgi:pSer/pThr/pTyr-binding forkhead associated (FHA) protein
MRYTSRETSGIRRDVVTPNIRIMIMNGEQNGSGFSFNADKPDFVVRIGRGTDNDIPLPEDEATSRSHAVIRWEQGQWLLEDLGSKNGTHLGRTSSLERDERIRGKVVLRSGQLFRIGRTWLRFENLN